MLERSLVKNPVMSEAFPGFYVIPTIEDHAISKDGVVIRLVDGAPVEQRLSEYYAVDVRGRTYHVHRLMATTFLECEGDYDRYVVNHIDGIKTRNVLDNLEWTDHSGNLIHAYLSGLRDDNLVVRIKDILTDEVREFYSLNACARHFGVNQAKIHWALNLTYPCPLFEKYAITVGDLPFPPFTKDDIFHRGKTMPKPVVCETLDGSEAWIYEDAALGAASRCVSADANLLRYHLSSVGYLKDPSVGKVVDGYRWYYLADYRRVRNTLKRFNRPKRTGMPLGKDGKPIVRKPVPIEVLDTVSNSRKRWTSIAEFAESLGATKAAVQKSVHKNQGRFRHYQVRYLKSNTQNLLVSPTEMSVR